MGVKPDRTRVQRNSEVTETEVFTMDPEPRCDLWPAMLRMVDTSGSILPWYDWALIGVSAGALTFFPQLILVFIYQL
jgi:hypothetical protein